MTKALFYCHMIIPFNCFKLQNIILIIIHFPLLLLPDHIPYYPNHRRIHLTDATGNGKLIRWKQFFGITSVNIIHFSVFEKHLITSKFCLLCRSSHNGDLPQARLLLQSNIFSVTIIQIFNFQNQLFHFSNFSKHF